MDEPEKLTDPLTNIVAGQIVIGGVTFSADGIALTPGAEATDWAWRFVGSFNANAEAEKRGAVKALRDMADNYHFIVLSGGMEWPDIDDWLRDRADAIEKGTDR